VGDQDMHDKAFKFIEALGGADNIVEIEECITRLRGTLNDPSKVDLKQLQRLRIVGRPMLMGKGIQIVVGTYAELIGTEMNKIMRGKWTRSRCWLLSAAGWCRWKRCPTWFSLSHPSRPAAPGGDAVTGCIRG
jgi:glucose-like phosphotransferase system IIB component